MDFRSGLPLFLCPFLSCQPSVYSLSTPPTLWTNFITEGHFQVELSSGNRIHFLYLCAMPLSAMFVTQCLWHHMICPHMNVGSQNDGRLCWLLFLDQFFWILGCYVEGPSQIQAGGLPIWDDFRWRLIRFHLRVRKERISWDMVSYNGGFNCFQILGVHDPFLDSILHVESY